MATQMTHTSKADRNPIRPPYFADLSAAVQMLSPAIVLPVQFHDLTNRASAIRGEVALMHAVLFDAVECFRKQADHCTSHDRRLAHEAEQWLFTNNDDWPFSFVNVCAWLQLDPAYIRRGLRSWRQMSRAHPPRNRLRRMLVLRFTSIAA